MNESPMNIILDVQTKNNTLTQTITSFLACRVLKNKFGEEAEKKFKYWCKGHDIRQDAKTAALRLFNCKEAYIGMLNIIMENPGDTQNIITKASEFIIKKYAEDYGNLYGERYKYNSPVFLPRLPLLPNAENRAKNKERKNIINENNINIKVI